MEMMHSNVTVRSDFRCDTDAPRLQLEVQREPSVFWDRELGCIVDNSLGEYSSVISDDWWDAWGNQALDRIVSAWGRA